MTTRLDKRGNPLIIDATDTVKIMAKMQVDPADLGQLATLKMAAYYQPATGEPARYFMRQGQEWVDWSGEINQLADAEIPANIPIPFELFEQLEMTLYEGTLMALPGHFTIYLGYAKDQTVVFNGQQPIELIVQP